MPLEAMQPVGRGRNKAKPLGLPPRPVRQERTRMEPKGLPKRSAEICAAINEKASPMARPTDAICTSLTVDGAARCRSPVLAHVLQNVLPIGWVPHGVACDHVVGSASSNHHARLHIAARRFRIHHVANTLRHAPECHSVKGDAASQSRP